MKKKYYGVKKGRNTGVYESWSECEEQVKGFSGAEYKSFLTLKGALDFVNGNKEVKEGKDISELNNNEMIAYVDGSFDKDKGYYSYGAIMFTVYEKITSSSRGNDSELIEMRNVAGEIEGAMAAMDIALKNNIDILYLYYDYIGIEKWATGEWKANKVGTKRYVEYYNSIKDSLKVVFIKVKAHSGDKYNEEVDTLAKEALNGNID